MKPGTYVYVLLLALDRFAAAALYNRSDITISSLAWVVLTAAQARARPQVQALDMVAFKALEKLRLSKWQMRSLLYVGKALEWLSPGHCAGAREADLNTCAATGDLLAPLTLVKAAT